MVCKRPSVYACACAHACFRACAAARACAHAVPVPALPLERTAALAAAPALAALPTLFGTWQAADINQRGVLSSKASMLVRLTEEKVTHIVPTPSRLTVDSQRVQVGTWKTQRCNCHLHCLILTTRQLSVPTTKKKLSVLTWSSACRLSILTRS